MFTPPEAYSVSAITGIIQDLFDTDERMQDVTVTGEISNYKAASSGHLYFSLKDDKAQIRCAMWRTEAMRLRFSPRDGDQVIVHGRISVYAPNGQYQLYVDAMRPVGIGDLYQQFEELKARLAEEGLFDSSRKRPLPPLPRVIGVVTSPEAAAFQDVLNVLRRRYPLATVILSPTLVQGDQAPPQIVRALERLNQRSDVDVILICRGGGSIEDLWAFNDERVARAIAASRVPVICGVGHETDTTIADFAADVRAPTPSAAVEMLTPDIADLKVYTAAYRQALIDRMRRRVQDARAALERQTALLRRLSPVAEIGRLRQRLDEWNTRLITIERGRIRLLRERVASRAAALNASNPLAILDRGFALVSVAETGDRLTSALNPPPRGTRLHLQFKDGRLAAALDGTVPKDEP